MVKLYSIGEEIANSITHGVGALLSIAALVLLIVFSAIYGTALHVVASTIYGGTLVILYTMSTLYHAITNETAKKVLRILDHSSVYLLIAGTYTPFTLLVLTKSSMALGITLCSVVWGLAILGIIFSVFFTGKMKIFTTIMYVLLGWFIIFVFPTLLSVMKDSGAMPGIYLLVAGGLAYTVGAVFYIIKKRYFHSIWHGFVLLGSILHFFAVLLYVI